MKQVIKIAEEQLIKTQLLLYRLSERCDRAATEIAERDHENCNVDALFLETEAFLFEMKGILDFVAFSCADKEDYLQKCIEELVEVQQLHLLKKAA